MVDGTVPPPCPACGGPRYFYKKAGPRCKACLAQKARERYRANPEVFRERKRANYRKDPAAAVARSQDYYRRNADEVKQKKRDRHRANPEPARAAARAAYAADPEASKARNRAWLAANPERAAEWRKAWIEAHPGRQTELNRAYYAENREAEIARALAYAKAHPEVGVAIKHRREARKRQVICEHGAGCVDAAFLAVIRASACMYCGGPGGHADHFYPLSRDGLHCRENIVPACQSCNCRKRSTDPHVWMARLIA